MTQEFLAITRDIADRLEDLKSADDWRSAELAEQIALQAARLDRLVRAEREGAAGREDHEHIEGREARRHCFEPARR